MAFDNSGNPAGADNAPIGAEAVQSAPVADSTPAPTPIELKDDLLVSDPRTGKPVKYSEYNRTFQSQFTRASQEASRLKQELERERAQREAYEKRFSQPANQPGQDGPNLFEKIKALPYLNGEAAAEMVQAIGGEMAKRDQILTAVVKELLQAKQILSGLHGQSVTQGFDSKINNWIQEAGYDPKAPGMVDVAKEIYLAYEGNGLDQEFPRILSERLKQLEAIYEAKRNAAVQSARRAPFLPGKGGQANPSKPLELDPKLNPKQIADQVWGHWHANET